MNFSERVLRFTKPAKRQFGSIFGSKLVRWANRTVDQLSHAARLLCQLATFE
jgi:hypothetical protein